MSTDTYTHIVRGIVHTAQVAHVNLPDLDLEKLAVAQYAGDPRTELTKRLAARGSDDHQDAFARLAEVLTPDQAWAAVVETFDTDPHGAEYSFRELVDAGMIPGDERLYDVVAGSTPEQQAFAIAQAIRFTRPNASCATLDREGIFSRDRLWQFVKDTDQPVGWAMWMLTKTFGGVSDQMLEELVKRVANHVGVELTRETIKLVDSLGDFTFILSVQQTLRIVERGTLADLVVAASLGRCSQEVTELMLTRRGGLALLADEPKWSPEIRPALLRAVEHHDSELRHLRSHAAIWVLEHAKLDDVDQLLAVVGACGNYHAWLAGAYYPNRPTLDGVRTALARGLVTAANIVDRSEFGPVRNSDWLPVIVTETPGIVGPMLDELEKVGGQLRHLEDKARGLSVILNAVANVLDGDERLWARMLSSTEGSPFRNPKLTVGEAAQVYRDRWAAAEARQGFPEHDYRNCVTEHDPTARHPRGSCALGGN